jgi:hypothetical protein
MSTKQERESEKKAAIENLRSALCNGKPLHMIWKGSTPNANGRAIRYSVFITDDESDRLLNLTYWIAKAAGFRYNEKSGTISLGGYGYSRTDAIAESVAYALGVEKIPYNEY